MMQHPGDGIPPRIRAFALRRFIEQTSQGGRVDIQSTLEPVGIDTRGRINVLHQAVQPGRHRAQRPDELGMPIGDPARQRNELLLDRPEEKTSDPVVGVVM